MNNIEIISTIKSSRYYYPFIFMQFLTEKLNNDLSCKYILRGSAASYLNIKKILLNYDNFEDELLNNSFEDIDFHFYSSKYNDYETLEILINYVEEFSKKFGTLYEFTDKMDNQINYFIFCVNGEKSIELNYFINQINDYDEANVVNINGINLYSFDYMYKETKLYINYFIEDIDYTKKIIEQAKKLNKNADESLKSLNHLHKKLERKNIVLNYMENIMNDKKISCA